MDVPTPDEGILALLMEAEELKLAGQYEDALHLLESVLVQDPDNIAALEEVAENELNLQRHERARKAAIEAMELDAESYMAHYVLGFLHTQEEAWEDALPFLLAANKHKPNNPEILRCLGYALFGSGNRVQGAVTLERALNLEPDNTLILCDLGVASLQQQDFAKAKALFQRALDLEPDNIRAKECVDAVEKIRQRYERVG